MPTWLQVLVVVAAAYVFFAVFAGLVADRMIFRPPPPGYREGPRLSRVTADDGVSIAALHLRVAQPRSHVLYLHGNAEDLAGILPRLEALHARGHSVLAIDYRGYGATPGQPDEANVIADAAAALRHLCALEGIGPQDVVLYGRSLGGGPAVALAARGPARALVLEGAFTSAFRVVTQVPLVPGDRFRNIARLQRVRCPVLVVHGTDDPTVPFSHGRRLLAAAPAGAEHLWVEGAGHNDVVEVAGEAFWQAFDRLLAATMAERARTAGEP